MRQLMSYAEEHHVAVRGGRETLEDKIPPERLWAVAQLMNGDSLSVKDFVVDDDDCVDTDSSTSAATTTTTKQKVRNPYDFYESRGEMLRLMSRSVGMPRPVLEKTLAKNKSYPANQPGKIYATTGAKGKCPLCFFFTNEKRYTVNKEGAFKRHFDAEHPIDYVELYVCNCCDAWFRERLECAKHVAATYVKNLGGGAGGGNHPDGQADPTIGIKRVFNRRREKTAEEEKLSSSSSSCLFDSWNKPLLFSDAAGDFPPTTIYSCRLCPRLMLEPIHVHYHLLADHGVEMAVARNFYRVIDRSRPDFNQDNWERERFQRENGPGAVEIEMETGLWFVCYLCGRVETQELDLKSHLVGKHGAEPPVLTVVRGGRMVFCCDTASGAGKEEGLILGGAVSKRTRDKLLAEKNADDQDEGKTTTAT